MLIIITGSIGNGKTTVCRKLLNILRSQGCVCSGILTYKGADRGIVIEDVKSGEEMALASTAGIFAGPSTVRYHFNPRGIDFGLKAISENAGDVKFIDEIGKLELRGEGFTNALELLKSGGFKNCVLVIRSELLADFWPQLPEAPLVFETTADNRDKLPETIASLLLETLKKI